MKVIELVVERRVGRVASAAQEESVSVGRRAHDRLSADGASSTWPVLDHERPAEPLRQPLAHQARDDIDPTAGGKSDNDTHRPRRIGLRPRDPRQNRQRGSARR